MKPPRFEYHDPATLAQAVDLLARLPNGKLLAGGQSLMPMLNMRFLLPDHVIDLDRVAGLSGIRVESDTLVIGAMTRQREIEGSAVVRARLPLMHEAILQVGHRQTRNRGTLGGSLCHLDPAAELVTVAAACDAVIDVVGPGGERALPIADFAAGYMTPAIEPDEIVTAARFPCWSAGHGWGFVELARRHGDFAVVAAAALLECDADGRVTRAALALGGATPVPVRMREVERTLLGRSLDARALAEACEPCRRIDAVGDVHAPAAYRRQLAVVMARRALEAAGARAGTAGSREARGA